MLKIIVETSIPWSHPGDGIVGCLIVKDDFEPISIYGTVKSCTESQSIVIGFTRALERVKSSGDVIVLCTSCTFVFNALNNRWPEVWEHKRYIGAKGKVIRNAREWHQLIEAIKGNEIEIRLINSEFLRDECLLRAEKHGFFFSSVRKSDKKI